MLSIGDKFRIHYPADTTVGASIDFRPRQLVILKFRDLVREPLTPEEFRRRPMIYRGRYLAMARTENGRIRQFYESSCRETFRPANLRVALYTLSGEFLDIISREFENTKADRERLLAAVTKAELLDLPETAIRVVASDLRFVG